MSTKRTYGEACGLAHAAELIGERWALLVVRELLLGPKRFTDLRAGIPRVSPNVLGQRLRELEAGGVVARRTLPPPAGSKVYELTDWGRELEPILLPLGAWAARSRGFPVEAGMSPDAIMLGTKAMFDPEMAGGAEAEVAVLLNGQPYRLAVTGGDLELSHDTVADPDAVVETDPKTFAGVILGELSIDDAVGSGAFELDGDRGAFEAILGTISQPDRVPEPAAIA